MTPSVSVLILLVAAPWASLGCSQASPPPFPTPGPLDRSCYAVMDGQSVRSTLVRMQARGRERLLGMTELGSGQRLVEEATLDESGQLVEAEATLSEEAGAKAGAGTGEGAGQGERSQSAAEADGRSPVTRVVLRPARGTVELTTPALHVEWRVPNDLPWVWASLLTAPSRSRKSSGDPIATPLDGRVAFRAAQNGRAVRLLDLGALQHHTVIGDQLVIPEGASATVMLANDVIDIENGTPRRLRLSALDATLELFDAAAPSGALVAALRCEALSGSFAP